MSKPRASFNKRQREQAKREKQAGKAERRAAIKSGTYVPASHEPVDEPEVQPVEK